MNGWKTCKLGDLINEGVAKLQTGPFGTMLHASEYVPEGIPIIAVQDIADNKLSYHKFVYVNLETASRLSRYCVQENDIIFGRKGAIERRAIIKKKEAGWLQGSDCIRLRFLKSMDAPFISYQFGSSTYKEWMMQNATGATMPSLNQEVLKQLPIRFPLLAEQKAIAAVLTSLDNKIDLLHRQNDTLEAMAETLFRQWFVEEAQADWAMKPLKEVVDVGIGRTPPRKEAEWFSTNPTDVKWISIKDLGNNGVFIAETSEYLTRAAVQQFKIPIIPIQTVVLSFKMTVGRVAITSEAMLSNEAIAHFKFNKTTPFSKEYLFIFLKTYKYDLLGTTSSIVTSINSALIKEMEIPIPDRQTLNEFKARTEPLFEKIKANQAQIRTLSTLRDTLLPKLMNGLVRVQM